MTTTINRPLRACALSITALVLRVQLRPYVCITACGSASALPPRCPLWCSHAAKGRQPEQLGSTTLKTSGRWRAWSTMAVGRDAL
eukprot:7390399-Prymnesium_polylepis.1